MKINSIILGAYYSCQANNYADMKVCINTYFVNTNRNISLNKKYSICITNYLHYDVITYDFVQFEAETKS